MLIFWLAWYAVATAWCTPTQQAEFDTALIARQHEALEWWYGPQR